MKDAFECINYSKKPRGKQFTLAIGDTDRDRQTETQRETETERQTDRLTETERNRETERRDLSRVHLACNLQTRNKLCVCRYTTQQRSKPLV